MGKAEIIAGLDRLSPEELGEVRARLDQLDKRARAHSPATNSAPRICTPHLANRSESRRFIKQVMDLPADAKL